ncbi:MAG TPA: DM13 domain-containing protein, partial [Aggregatilineales bacterium]|nr:DM13 domain-containing protein [Aggregatilineales bacterium]
PRTPDEMMAGDSAVMLGVLKGHIGAQNYNIPLEIDISQYASVVIYSPQFERIFSTATLQQPIQ